MGVTPLAPQAMLRREIIDDLPMKRARKRGICDGVRAFGGRYGGRTFAPGAEHLPSLAARNCLGAQAVRARVEISRRMARRTLRLVEASVPSPSTQLSRGAIRSASRRAQRRKWLALPRVAQAWWGPARPGRF